MFNIYTTEIRIEKDPIRQSIIDTLKCFLKIADNELVNTYLTRSIEQFKHYSELYEKSSKTTADLNNNNTSQEAQKSEGKKKVVFDFNKTTSSKTGPAATSATDANLFAKYSFLDLISFLVKYSNEKNIVVVYNLAINGIEVNFFNYSHGT
jgi:hypothetical protein